MLKPNFVLVIDQNKKPLNPCLPSVARKLLNSNKAAVFRRFPFVIILKKSVEMTPELMTLKLDPGSKTTGFALLQGDAVVWGMELAHRGAAIKDALSSRAATRRNRRSRNTRYRAPRFLNRTRPKGWLPPSLLHRVLTTEIWVKKLIRYAPIGEIRQELVRFDMQKMDDETISGAEYQQGTLAGYEVREYLLEKWSRKCSYCSKEGIPLEIEHIKARSKGGSNAISNLCLACHSCNQKKSDRPVEEFLSKKPDLLKKIKAQAKAPLKDAAAVNSTRWKLYEVLQSTGIPISVGTGGQTKFNRIRFELPKAHWIDAACVGVVDSLRVLTSQPLLVKATGWGTRQMCRMDKFGFPCSKGKIPHKHGWKTGDVGRLGKVVGRVVPQSETRLEIRAGKARHGGKVDLFEKLHSKDGYSYG